MVATCTKQEVTNQLRPFNYTLAKINTVSAIWENIALHVNWRIGYKVYNAVPYQDSTSSLVHLPGHYSQLYVSEELQQDDSRWEDPSAAVVMGIP